MACRYLPPHTLFNMAQYTPERMHRMAGWTRCFRPPRRLRRGQVLARPAKASADPWLSRTVQEQYVVWRDP